MSAVYVTTMYRWGDREAHSYIIGIFTDHRTALAAGEREEDYRGGKYSAAIDCYQLDTDGSCRDAPFPCLSVKGLPDQRRIILRKHKALDVVEMLLALANEQKAALKSPALSMAQFCRKFLTIMETIK